MTNGNGNGLSRWTLFASFWPVIATMITWLVVVTANFVSMRVDLITQMNTRLEIERKEERSFQDERRSHYMPTEQLQVVINHQELSILHLQNAVMQLRDEVKYQSHGH